MFAELKRRGRAERPSPLHRLPRRTGRRDRARRQRKPSFRREVEACVEPLLAAGDANIDRVARELGLSRQTLYRRLKAEGVTFEQLLDELRHRLALKLLRDAAFAGQAGRLAPRLLRSRRFLARLQALDRHQPELRALARAAPSGSASLHPSH